MPILFFDLSDELFHSIDGTRVMIDRKEQTESSQNFFSHFYSGSSSSAGANLCASILPILGLTLLVQGLFGVHSKLGLFLMAILSVTHFALAQGTFRAEVSASFLVSYLY